MQYPMPVPAGQPLRLPAQVAGSLSRIQGQLQANQAQMQNAYAMHWLATRQAGFVPEFQQFTQSMLWGLYGTTALSGMLRWALSGRATPEVMAGVVDQLNLISHSYGQAAQSLQQFLEQPDARDFEYVEPMVRSLQPLDRAYQGLAQPMQTVVEGVSWSPGPLIDLPGIRAAIPETGDTAGGA